MPDYKITVSEEGDKVLQKALTAQNSHLEAGGDEPYETMDDFLTDQIEAEFGISDEELASTQRKEAVDAVVQKLTALPVEAIAEIAVAVDATVSKYPGKLGGPIEVKP